MAMDAYIIPLEHLDAGDADRVGPKAANLAALSRVGLPTPGGFCLTADAYRLQMTTLGLDDAAQRYVTAEPPEAPRLSVAIRLGLYERPIAPAILEPLLSAWRTQPAPGVVRSSALIEDR